MVTHQLKSGSASLLAFLSPSSRFVSQADGAPVSLTSADDQTTPAAATEAMTKLIEVDKVAGVVGSFSSRVSSAAVDQAVRAKVMLISPGSTSPVFTERAKKETFRATGREPLRLTPIKHRPLLNWLNKRGLSAFHDRHQ